VTDEQLCSVTDEQLCSVTDELLCSVTDEQLSSVLDEQLFGRFASLEEKLCLMYIELGRYVPLVGVEFI
jgi:hypothetical protein